MTANSPNGHYIDVLGKPLVAPIHDPTIFLMTIKTTHLISFMAINQMRIILLN